jgi:hypothetical protein
MKKVLIFVFVIFLSTSMSAQTKSEEQATKFTKEMKQVLALNEVETKQVYALQLEKITLIKENRDIKGTPEFKAIMRPASKKIAKILGKDRMNSWRAHLEAKKQK